MMMDYDTKFEQMDKLKNDKPKVTYFLNWMGPINKEWCDKFGNHWCGGRVDVWDPEDNDPYGSVEYGIDIMHKEDWAKFAKFLHDLESDGVVSKKDLLDDFETLHGKIRWFDYRRILED